MDGGAIDHVRVTNIVAKNTGNGLFIRLGNRVQKTPGSISNVYIGNIKVDIPFTRPDIHYDLRAPDCGFHNTFAASITGIPGYRVENITIENVEMTYPGKSSKAQAYFPLWRLRDYPEKITDYPEFSMFGETPSWGFYVRHVQILKMKGIVLKLDDSDFRPAFIFDDAKNVQLNNINLPAEKNKNQILMRDSDHVDIQNSGELVIKALE